MAFRGGACSRHLELGYGSEHALLSLCSLQRRVGRVEKRVVDVSVGKGWRGGYVLPPVVVLLTLFRGREYGPWKGTQGPSVPAVICVNSEAAGLHLPKPVLFLPQNSLGPVALL